MVWFAAHHPQLHLSHLEQRMRQTGHWSEPTPLSEPDFRQYLDRVIDNLDTKQARQEVEPFIKNPQILSLWSRDFFRDVARRITIV